MQCRWLSVWSVNFNSFSYQNCFFQGYGGAHNTRRNSGGVGGIIFVFKIWKFWGGGGGGLCEIPSMVGVWIFSGTTHLIIFDSFPFMFSYIINLDCIALYCIVLIQKLLLQFLVV